jgi:hypothetical protein
LTLKTKDVMRSVIGEIYRAGYDEITIDLLDKMTLMELNQLLNDYFIGLDVKEFTGKTIKIISITSTNIEDYHFFANKMFVTIRAMIDELVMYFKEGKFNYEDIKEMRKSNLKAREFCMRAINKLSNVEKNVCEMYAFLLIIEKISGELWHIGQYAKNNKPKKSADIVQLLLLLKDLIVKLHHFYEKKDYDSGIHDVLNDRFVLRKNWFKGNKLKLLFAKKDLDPVVLSLIMQMRMNIASAASRYVTATMDLEKI